jgi:hypothetical protein
MVCFSSSVIFTTDTTSSHSHSCSITPSLSRSLCCLALFPLLSISYKYGIRVFVDYHQINVFHKNCSHFKGDINTKYHHNLCPLKKKFCNIKHLVARRRFIIYHIRCRMPFFIRHRMKLINGRRIDVLAVSGDVEIGHLLQHCQTGVVTETDNLGSVSLNFFHCHCFSGSLGREY